MDGTKAVDDLNPIKLCEGGPEWCRTGGTPASAIMAAFGLCNHDALIDVIPPDPVREVSSASSSTAQVDTRRQLKPILDLS
jgi:hypothetical protein